MIRDKNTPIFPDCQGSENLLIFLDLINAAKKVKRWLKKKQKDNSNYANLKDSCFREIFEIYFVFQPKIYRAVIEDVIKNVRESFLNDGVDEQVLNELKQVRKNCI